MEENKIELHLVGMTTGHSQRGSYTLILGTDESNIKLPIVVGSFEAQAIAIAIEKIKTQRPMTHDLIRNWADKIGVGLKEVVITKLFEGVFYAELICEQNGNTYSIDARTSDAIALALRFDCPIYSLASIVDQAGVEIDEQFEVEEEAPERSKEHFQDKITDPENAFANNTLEELQNLLNDAEQTEDYEKAALIRDEINKRNQN